ncbi:MAG: glutathione S-transferase family protein [Coleofasciculaceae cyanobacterium]
MLKLYYSPTSPNSRRIWIALLEKGLEFELVEINLIDNEQFKPEFLKLNPFHQVPILLDDGFNVVESLAILDYLEAKYPIPSLMPTEAKAMATVRMVALATDNELMPAIAPLFGIFLGLPTGEFEKIEQAKQQVSVVLTFFEHLLGDNPFFGGEHLTLAEVAAGTVITQLYNLEISLSDYPKLNAWSERLMLRAAWAKTQPSVEAWEVVKTRYRAMFAQQT